VELNTYKSTMLNSNKSVKIGVSNRRALSFIYNEKYSKMIATEDTEDKYSVLSVYPVAKIILYIQK
jgi:hypothetical protein